MFSISTAAIKPAPSSNGGKDDLITSIIAVVLGVGSGLVVVILVALVVLKFRYGHIRQNGRQGQIPAGTKSGRNGQNPPKNSKVGIATNLLTPVPSSSSHLQDDADPDLIPRKGGKIST